MVSIIHIPSHGSTEDQYIDQAAKLAVLLAALHRQGLSASVSYHIDGCERGMVEVEVRDR